MMPDISPASIHPSRVQIWPLGYGVVLTSNCRGGWLQGSFLIAAVPDQFLVEDWKRERSEEEFPVGEIFKAGGPICALQFKDLEAIDRFMGDLATFREGFVPPIFDEEEK